jgi:lysozyme family protein
MADFEIAYLKTSGNEGHILTDTAGDRGGLTYGAVASTANPDWEGFEYIKKHGIKVGQNNPVLDAMEKKFLKVRYWNPFGGDIYEDQDLANQEYDAAVNGGVGEAEKIMNES